MKLRSVQTALRLIYPPRCTICGDMVESEFGLCGPCWRDTPFIMGLCCDACGVPLPGGHEAEAGVLCDICLSVARPWDRGRAVFVYRDNGRKLILALKYGDRQEILRPAAGWMARSAAPMLTENTLIAPIPLHWMRMIKRTYNQSALLSGALARETGHDHCPDLLMRSKRTKTLNGMSRDERFETLDRAICAHPKRAERIEGRDILLVDDVMTTGATLSSATQACFAAGAQSVCVLTLARAAKDA